jgi:hypothetical protein
VKRLRVQLTLGLALLVCCGAIAGACAAYDVGFGDILRSLGQVSGLRPAQRRVRSANETIVSAGSELSVDRGAVTIRRLPEEEVTQRLAWAGIRQQDGWLMFQGETLASVAAVFNQNNGRQLVIGDHVTGRLRIGGKFRVNDVEGFLAALQVTHGVRAIPPGAARSRQGAPVEGRSGQGPTDERSAGDVIVLTGGQ